MTPQAILGAAALALILVSCSQQAPATAPAPAPAPAAAAAALAAPVAASGVSLAGKWAGTITCYKMVSPLQMNIDAAKPGEAGMSKGPEGALRWPATVAIDAAARLVTIKSLGQADGAARLEGVLSEDGARISGVMDKQLCTDFKLARQP